jgi:glycosyltransferase involved in cell wall biosynthesis
VIVQELDGRQLDSPDERLRVSVVIPCVNEAENIAECVLRARQVLRENQTSGEVLVVDNASTDGSGDLARAVGAIVVEDPRRGYGNAYHAGFARARGDYIIMADADLTYARSRRDALLANSPQRRRRRSALYGVGSSAPDTPA